MVHRVIDPLAQLQGHLAGLVVGGRPRGLLALRVRDDQRRARLVNQDAVHLIHDGVMVPALHLAGRPHRRLPLQHPARAARARGVHPELIAQVIEGELLVRPVGDVRLVRRDALLVRDAVHQAADRQAEGAVDVAHPLRVAAGQEVVDGHHVHAAAAQRVEEGGHGGRQRLALAGLHLGDPAPVHDGGAEHLRVEVPLRDLPAGGLAHQGVGLRLDVLQRLAHAQAAAQLGGGLAQLRVAALADLALQRIDELHHGPHGAQSDLVRDKVWQVSDHRW